MRGGELETLGRGRPRTVEESPAVFDPGDGAPLEACGKERQAPQTRQPDRWEPPSRTQGAARRQKSYREPIEGLSRAYQEPVKHIQPIKQQWKHSKGCAWPGTWIRGVPPPLVVGGCCDRRCSFGPRSEALAIGADGPPTTAFPVRSPLPPTGPASPADELEPFKPDPPPAERRPASEEAVAPGAARERGSAASAASPGDTRRPAGMPDVIASGAAPPSAPWLDTSRTVQGCRSLCGPATLPSPGTRRLRRSRVK